MTQESNIWIPISNVSTMLLTEHPRTTMIRIIYEYMIIWTAVYDFPATSLNRSFIAEKNGKKVVNGNIISNIVLFNEKSAQEETNAVPIQVNQETFAANLWNILVDILAMRAVDDDSRPWIFFIVSNVIIHKNDNVFIFETASFEDLVRMAYISLL